jgi:hypothetical protein
MNDDRTPEEQAFVQQLLREELMIEESQERALQSFLARQSSYEDDVRYEYYSTR